MNSINKIIEETETKKCPHIVLMNLGKQDKHKYGKRALEIGLCQRCYSRIIIDKNKYKEFAGKMYILKEVEE